MHAFRNWRWSVLAVAFGLMVPVARASWITPDSISNPPSAVASANSTPVSADNLVTVQYKGLGLNFSRGGALVSGAAITNLNGTNVWASAEGFTYPGGSNAGSSLLNPPVAQINYSSTLSGSIVSPGSLNPMAVSSLAVEIVGNGTFPLPSLSMHVYGRSGQMLPITPLIGLIADEQDWTFTGPGISSFSADQTTSSSQPWGVAGVSFTSATTPEPTSLVLAGLGVLGLAVRSGWRNRRTVA